MKYLPMNIKVKDRFNDEVFIQHYDIDTLYVSNYGRLLSIKKQYVKEYEPLKLEVRRGILINYYGHYGYVYVANDVLRLHKGIKAESNRCIHYKDGNLENCHVDNLYIGEHIRYSKPKNPHRLFVEAKTGIYNVRSIHTDKVVFRSGSYAKALEFDKWQQNKSQKEIADYPQEKVVAELPKLHLHDLLYSNENSGLAKNESKYMVERINLNHYTRK